MSYRPTIKTNSAGATSDFPLDADTVDGYHASALAKVQSANDFLVDSNEFNFVSNGFTGEVWFNYKTVGGYNGNITEYKFGDGAGNLLGIAIHSGNVSNYVPTKTSDLQNDSGFITSSAIPSSLPANGGTSDYAMALYGEDYRVNDFTPDEYNGQTRIVTEFKDGYNIGYTGTQYSYGNLTTIVQWNDSSGGYPTQIFTSSNLGTIGIRYGTSDSTWSSWKEIATTDMLSNYLPLTGGTMTGVLVTKENGDAILMRNASGYYSGINYRNAGNEAMCFENQNSLTSWIFRNINPGNSVSSWDTITPAMQIKNQRVTINKLIPNGQDASYNLDVGGTANFDNQVTACGGSEGIVIKNSSGGESSIKYDRGVNTSWKSGVSGGNYFLYEGNTQQNAFYLEESSQGSRGYLYGVQIATTPQLQKYDGTCYYNLGSYYNAGQTASYVRIRIPDKGTNYTMAQLEISIRQSYSDGWGGKLIINGYGMNSEPYWHSLNGYGWGNMGRSAIKVYGSGKDYIYIEGVSAWGGLSVDRLLLGDSITGADLTNSVEVDGVSSLPSGYVTAVMRFAADLGDLSGYMSANGGTATSGDTTIANTSGSINIEASDDSIYLSSGYEITLTAYESELNSASVKLVLNDDERGTLSVIDSGGSGGAYREILRVNDDDITYKGNSLRHYRHNIYLRFSNIVISTHFYSSSASAVSKSTFAQNIVYNSDYYPRGIWATGFTVDSEEGTSTPSSNYSGWIYVDSDGYLYLLRPNGSITGIDNFSFSDSVTEV